MGADVAGWRWLAQSPGIGLAGVRALGRNLTGRSRPRETPRSSFTASTGT